MTVKITFCYGIALTEDKIFPWSINWNNGYIEDWYYEVAVPWTPPFDLKAALQPIEEAIAQSERIGAVAENIVESYFG